MTCMRCSPVYSKTSMYLLDVAEISLQFSGQIANVIDDIYFQTACNDCAACSDFFQVTNCLYFLIEATNFRTIVFTRFACPTVITQFCTVARGTFLEAHIIVDRSIDFYALIGCNTSSRVDVRQSEKILMD